MCNLVPGFQRHEWSRRQRREDRMTTDNRVVSCSAALLLLIECAATISAVPIARVAPGNTQITVLYDAFGKTSTMQKDWGYAALIEYGGKRILFDTGNNPEVLAQNAKAKGVDLTKLDFVVMSHRHGDHMGGLTYLLKVNPTVKIYAPKEGFGVYGADLPSSFYRKDTSLPPEQRYYAGGLHLVVASDSDIEKIVTALRDRFKVEYVAPGHCTGEPAFTELKKAFRD